jgi:hypothetical protein
LEDPRMFQILQRRRGTPWVGDRSKLKKSKMKEQNPFYRGEEWGGGGGGQRIWRSIISPALFLNFSIHRMWKRKKRRLRSVIWIFLSPICRSYVQWNVVLFTLTLLTKKKKKLRNGIPCTYMFCKTMSCEQFSLKKFEQFKGAQAWEFWSRLVYIDKSYLGIGLGVWSKQ